jgi:hypothetical protein
MKNKEVSAMKLLMFGMTVMKTTRKRRIGMFHLCMSRWDEAYITDPTD